MSARPEPVPALQAALDEPEQDSFGKPLAPLEVPLPHIEHPQDSDMILKPDKGNPEHPFESASTRGRTKSVYRVEFSFREICQLCQFLQRAAERADSFTQVREAVLMCELVRIRAKQAGF